MPNRRLSLAALAVVVAPLVACDGLKSAFSANPDVVAKAGTQQLSVERLGNLLGGSGVPVSKQNARALADLWVAYTLAAEAAVKGDSLADVAADDAAIAAYLDQMRLRAWQPTFFAELEKQVDTSQFAQRYTNGQILHASHILVAVPQDASPARRAELKAKADLIRAKVTPAGFAAQAKLSSDDPGSAQRGGLLGAFQPGQMVPQFEQGTLATPPGGISPVIESQFGYHIIYRSTWEQARPEVQPALAQLGMAAAESAYVAKLEKEEGVAFKSNAIATLRTVVADAMGNLGNTTAIATLKGGNFTANDAAQLLITSQGRAQLAAQIEAAPDSLVRQGLLEPMVRTWLIFRQARAAMPTVDTAQVGEFRRSLSTALVSSWAGLGVPPQVLTDSAKTPEERTTFAVGRVDASLDRIVAGQQGVVQVPPPAEAILRKKYGARVFPAAIDKAVTKATAVRAQADSARAAQVPQSVVPLPGGADKALPTKQPE